MGLWGFLLPCSSLLLVSWGLADPSGLSWRGTHDSAFRSRTAFFRARTSRLRFCGCWLCLCCGARAALAVGAGSVGARGACFSPISFSSSPAAPRCWSRRCSCSCWLSGASLERSGGHGADWLRSGADRVVGVALSARQAARSIDEYQAYRDNDAPNSTGLHLEFLRKSLSFVEYGAGHRPRHRFDRRSCFAKPPPTRRERQATYAEIRTTRFSRVAIQLGLLRHHRSAGDVDGASDAVSRRRTDRLDRSRSSWSIISCRRFSTPICSTSRRVALRVWRWRRGRHGVCVERDPA